MILHALTVGQLDTNCYIVADEGSREAVVIDPGDDLAEIEARIAADGLKVVAIVDTHGHFDHILANAGLARRTQAPVCVHRADAALLTTPGFARAFGFPDAEPHQPGRLIEEGDEIGFGPLRLKVIHTPGHSPGSICLLLEEGAEVEGARVAGGRKLLFAGDTLFCGGIGRTDLPGGSPRAMEASLAKLMRLEGDVVVYPGHGPETTIGRERRQNPWLR